MQPTADGVISKLRFIADVGAINVTGSYAAVALDYKFDDNGQPVLILEQRGGAGRKLFRQHGKITHPRVDGRSLVRGKSINRGALRYERVHIGDGYPYFGLSIRQPLSNFQLIEVARSIVINGRPKKLAEIAQVGTGRDLRTVCFQIGKLLLNVRREVGSEAPLQHKLSSRRLQIHGSGMGVIHKVEFVGRYFPA